jgi:hypothetical protein
VFSLFVLILNDFADTLVGLGFGKLGLYFAVIARAGLGIPLYFCFFNLLTIGIGFFPMNESPEASVKNLFFFESSDLGLISLNSQIIVVRAEDKASCSSGLERISEMDIFL